MNRRLTHFALIVGLGLLAAPVVADEAPYADVLAELTEQLELTEEQQGEVAQHLMTFGKGLEAAAAEAEKEEPDAQKMIGDLKKARGEFQSNMKKTLDDEQYTKLETAVDQAIQGMFNDMAAIMLMDLEPVLELTEDQMVQLEPVMGTGLRGIIGLVLENADKRLTPPRKLSLGRSMKKIQSDMDKQVAGILTDEQWAKYQAMKESEG